jgi:hypothetical protein
MPQRGLAPLLDKGYWLNASSLFIIRSLGSRLPRLPREAGKGAGSRIGVGACAIHQRRSMLPSVLILMAT